MHMQKEMAKEKQSKTEKQKKATTKTINTFLKSKKKLIAIKMRTDEMYHCQTIKMNTTKIFNTNQNQSKKKMLK